MFIGDRVRQATSATGTGDIVLDGPADPGYLTVSDYLSLFDPAAPPSYVTVNYLIEDGAAFEIGEGYIDFTVTPPVLRVRTPFRVYDGTAFTSVASSLLPLNLSGSAKVSFTASIFNTVSGARLSGSTDRMIIPNSVAGATVNYTLFGNATTYIPFMLPQPFAIGSVLLPVVSGAANQAVAAAVYSYHGYRPMSLLTTANAATTTVTTNLNTSISLSAKLPPGTYALALYVSGANLTVQGRALGDIQIITSVDSTMTNLPPITSWLGGAVLPFSGDLSGASLTPAKGNAPIAVLRS